MRRKRIALVFPDHRVSGGVTRVAAFLRETINASGRFESFPVSLATFSGDRCSSLTRSPRTWRRGPRAEQESWEDTPIWHVGANLAELEFLRYRARRALSDVLDQADIVQVVAGSPAWALPCIGLVKPVLLQAATMAAWERARTLAGGLSPAKAWRRAMTRITDRLDQRALASVDWFFAENERMLRLAEGMSKAEATVQLAPPGIDVSRFHPDGYRPDGYILSVGRFSDPRKRFDLLVSAYRIARSRSRKIPPLVIVGEPPPPSQAQLIDRLGLTPFVRLRGAISDDELVSVYRGASLFVCASDEEGLGLAIIEAMACGVPTIATRCGGPEGSVRDGLTGSLTPLGDARGLADAVVALREDVDMRRDMSSAAREDAVMRFSHEATRDTYLAAYEEASER
jgi:glycosyltransferase involved in cell wall biosynthesis